eukprot:gene8135-8329_t
MPRREQATDELFLYATPATPDCAPGYMPVTDTKTCAQCSKGRYCPGSNVNGSIPAQRCPDGLVTVSAGAKSIAQCFTRPGYGRVPVQDSAGHISYQGVMCQAGEFNVVAPPGHYLSFGKAVKCQKGTYYPTYNNGSLCINCPDDLTTASEGSTSEDDCALVGRGMYLDPDDGQAKPCPLHTYQDQENADPACKQCPNGWLTQDIGTEGLADCLAPPGFELTDGASNCGVGLLTHETGSTQDDDCYVPPGMEAVQDPLTKAWSAQLCNYNRFGNNVPVSDLSASDCKPCPANTYTMDYLTGVNTTTGYQGYESCFLKPGWGWDGDNLAEPCLKGEYNPGFNRLPCSQCLASFTTLEEESSASSDCVIQPGWMFDQTRGLAKPCDLGYYSYGGSADDSYGNCTQCPLGYTTQLDTSVDPSACSVCAAGFGGSNCTLCPPGTYSSGGTDTECTPCRSGLTSQSGSVQNSQCLAVWPLNYAAEFVQIPLSDEAAWQRVPAGSTSQDDCESLCATDTTCMMYRYSVDGNLCDLYNGIDPTAANRAAVGFKAWGAGAVQDYSFYYIPSTVTVGEQLKDLGTVISLGSCTTACTNVENCLLVRVTGLGDVEGRGSFSCSLYAGVPDPDWVSSYKISGSGLMGSNIAIDTVT